MHTEQKIQFWAIVQIMGHQTYAGEVSEYTLAGTSFLRVDIPPVNNIPGFTELFSTSSIYKISPVEQEIAIAAAANLQKTPISIFSIRTMVSERISKLTAGEGQEEDQDFEDDNDDDKPFL